MIRRHVCFTAECSTPGCEPFDEYTPHFDTEEEAVEKLTREWGWRFRGKTGLCASHAAVRECERTGHEWSSGYTDPSTGVREEYCGRCNAASRLLATT